MTFLVQPAAGDHGLLAEHLPGRLGERLAAVEHEQHALGGVEAAVAQVVIRPRATEAFSVDPSTTPSGTFVPSAVTPSAPTMVWPAKSNPSTNTISQRSSSSGRARNSASRSAVAAMKRRLTELCDVPDAASLDLLADRLERLPVAAARQASEHRGDHLLGQQIDRRERVVALQPNLALGAILVGDRPYPRPAHRHPPAAERHPAGLAPVPVGARPGSCSLSGRPARHLGLDELAHHLQADRDRRGQQPLPHPLGEQPQLLAHAPGQPLRKRPILDQPQPRAPARRHSPYVILSSLVVLRSLGWCENPERAPRHGRGGGPPLKLLQRLGQPPSPLALATASRRARGSRCQTAGSARDAKRAPRRAHQRIKSRRMTHGAPVTDFSHPTRSDYVFFRTHPEG